MQHKIIIQRLNTTRPNNGVPTDYPVDAFRGVSFDGTPLILSHRAVHPSLNDVNTNALPSDCRIVGTIDQTRLIEAGTPRIEAVANIDDAAISTGVTAGAYAVSSGFAASITPTPRGQRIVGNVVPNHVLMFPVDAGIPNDGMAAFLNTADAADAPPLRDAGIGNNIICNAVHINTSTMEKNMNHPQIQLANADANSSAPAVAGCGITTSADVGVAMMQTLTSQIEILNTRIAERDAEIATKNAEIANAKQQVDELASANAKLHQQIEQDRKDREWAAISNAVNLPAALREKRELFESQPHMFVAELLNAAPARAVVRPAQGTTVAIANTADTTVAEQPATPPTAPHAVSGYRAIHTFTGPDGAEE